MPTLPTLTLICATFTTALITGLLYGYLCSVNPGLNRLADADYLSAMQSINRAIQNPVFFASFMGTLLLLPITTWLHYHHPISVRFWLLAGSTLIYLIGVFGVTVMGNIPLNEGLEAFSLQGASVEEITAQRAKFEASWDNWHLVRTVASVLSLLLAICACLQQTE